MLNRVGTLSYEGVGGDDARWGLVQVSVSILSTYNHLQKRPYNVPVDVRGPDSGAWNL